MILNLLFDLCKWQVEEGGLEVETLDEPLHVNSPLGTKARIDQICWGCELEISGILLKWTFGSWQCQSLRSSSGWTG